MSTNGNDTNKSSKPISAYMPVFLAFLSDSSSQKDLVYWMPDHTIAPTAKSAPNWTSFSAREVTKFLTQSTPSPTLIGLTPVVHSEQRLTYSAGDMLVVLSEDGGHVHADTDRHWNQINNPVMRKTIYFIHLKGDLRDNSNHSICKSYDNERNS
jgi:hypothetical protein